MNKNFHRFWLTSSLECSHVFTPPVRTGCCRILLFDVMPSVMSCSGLVIDRISSLRLKALEMCGDTIQSKVRQVSHSQTALACHLRISNIMIGMHPTENKKRPQMNISCINASSCSPSFSSTYEQIMPDIANC